MIFDSHNYHFNTKPCIFSRHRILNINPLHRMRHKMDAIDYQIVDLLTKNAQMPYTEVAKKLIISSGTVHARVKKMTEMGFIKGATLNLDYTAINCTMTTFLMLQLNTPMVYDKVIAQLVTIKEVVKIHHINGKYDVLVKVHTKDSIHFRAVYQQNILTIKGIKKVDSFISLEEKLSRHISFDAREMFTS